MTSSKERTLHDLTGKWSMNRSMSTDMSPVLALQGINLFMRKAAAAAPVYLDVKQPSRDELVVDSSTIASIPASQETWIHDWVEREYKMGFLGQVMRKSRWIKAGEVEGEVAYLIDGLDPSEEVIEEALRCEKGDWKARYVWRIEDGNMVRRLLIYKGKNTIEAKMVYEPDNK